MFHIIICAKKLTNLWYCRKCTITLHHEIFRYSHQHIKVIMDQKPMTLSILPESEWQAMKEGQRAIRNQLMELKSLLENIQMDTQEWLTLEEARDIIGVCPKTFQKYRDNGVIPFSQYGRKIYFKKSDIQAFLESKRIRRK